MQTLGAAQEGLTLVVTLSPRMVYSVTEWPRMRGLALQHGWQVVGWWAVDVPESEWRDAVAQGGWSTSDIDAVSPMPVACQAWVGQPNHFPFSRVIAAGRVHPWPIWGVLPDTVWTTALRKRVEDLTATATRGEGEP